MESIVPQWALILISIVITAETWELKGHAQKVNMEKLLVAAAILFEGL